MRATNQIEKNRNNGNPIVLADPITALPSTPVPSESQHMSYLSKESNSNTHYKHYLYNLIERGWQQEMSGNCHRKVTWKRSENQECWLGETQRHWNCNLKDKKTYISSHMHIYALRSLFCNQVKMPWKYRLPGLPLLVELETRGY